MNATTRCVVHVEDETIHYYISENEWKEKKISFRESVREKMSFI